LLSLSKHRHSFGRPFDGLRDLNSFVHKNLCKDGNFLEKNALLCRPNFIAMKKKLAIALLIAFVSGIVMMSCRSNKTCPAYGESQKYIKETRY